MKKNILNIAAAATVLLSASSVFAAEQAQEEAKAGTEQAQEEAKAGTEQAQEEAKK